MFTNVSKLEIRYVAVKVPHPVYPPSSHYNCQNKDHIKYSAALSSTADLSSEVKSPPELSSFKHSSFIRWIRRARRPADIIFK